MDFIREPLSVKGYKKKVASSLSKIPKNIFVSTYTFIYNGIRTNTSGPVVPMLNFFRNKVEKIYLLEQPLPGGDFLETQLTVVYDGREIRREKKNFFFSGIPKDRQDSTKTYIRLKVRDILSNFYFLWKNYDEIKEEGIDLFIGVESINAIFGLLLKKFGLCDKVVYYIFDWAPDRYPNPVMNKIYILLDKIATYYSDCTWNITYTIAEAKKDILNYDESKVSPQLYVPYCVDFNEDKILPDDKIDTNLIIYSGGLIDENGPQFLLKAYKIVLDKFHNSKLLIIGGGDLEDKLKDFIIKNNMEKNVEITGYIAEEERIKDLQCKGAIGVAPYPIMKGSRKPYGDVIKIRMYFACGLVTVSTPVPPVSKEIEEENLGYTTIDDSPEEIAKGICLLLENKELLFKYRKNVIEKAKSNTWERNYSSALRQMGFEMEMGYVI